MGPGASECRRPCGALVVIYNIDDIDDIVYIDYIDDLDDLDSPDYLHDLDRDLSDVCNGYMRTIATLPKQRSSPLSVASLGSNDCYRLPPCMISTSPLPPSLYRSERQKWKSF